MGFVALGSCGESSITVNVKSPVSVVSDKFISYEVNFFELMETFMRTKNLENIKSVAPAYIKLVGFSSYLKIDRENFNSSDVTLLFEFLK